MVALKKEKGTIPINYTVRKNKLSKVPRNRLAGLLTRVLFVM